MSKGNNRANGISDRKSHSQPNCEHQRDIGHAPPAGQVARAGSVSVWLLRAVSAALLSWVMLAGPAPSSPASF
jgi:hypothetical protein